MTPLHILVIEDDEDTRANLQDILELDDHAVVTAPSAAAALARNDLDAISVVLLDRRLPDGNAENLLATLKLAMPQADIIVVTGDADIESAILALQRGAADYISKPINPDVLRASLIRTVKQTELRNAKERSEANFTDLIETVAVLVLILDRNHVITYANRFAADLLGGSPAELHGKNISGFFDPDDRDRLERHFTRLGNDPLTTDEEIPMRCLGGELRWILWNFRFQSDSQGRQSILVVGTDVTQRRTLEQRALQAERLAAIGQMVTGLAHESRNALQRSQACLDALSDELVAQPEAQELVQRIQRAQHDLHRLYEEVRSYAAPITLHRELYPVDKVWRETWSHLEVARNRKQLLLREQILAHDLNCFIDPIALGQVFRNILENAIHVSRLGDHLSILVRKTVLRRHPALEVRIGDQGPGLTPEQVERIFEPFYTTKTQGTGLGMAIVKRIIDAHFGEIHVAPPHDTGAEIVLILPQTPE